VKRGTYRAVFSTLFDDPDYQRLPTRARLVLVTARQCKDAGPAAIFRYYSEILAHQTGSTPSQVKEALEVLAAPPGWIIYDDAVLWVRNGLRYDPSMSLANRKHRTAISKHLIGLPKSPVVLKFCDYYKIAYPFDTHSIPMPIPLPITETDTETETETTTSSSARGAPEAVAEEVSTPEQHAKEEPRWGTPEALIALYHELTKCPRVTLPLSPARTAKAKDYLKKFPAREFWVGAFTEIGQSMFLSGRRRDPGHEHFKVDFDWLLTKGKTDQVENVMKVYEGKYREPATQGAAMPHLWSCPVCGATHRGTEAQAQAKACLKGVA
jgi:hypothetical protein